MEAETGRLRRLPAGHAGSCEGAIGPLLEDRPQALERRPRLSPQPAPGGQLLHHRFDVRMTGRETIDGHDTIAFTLTPRPDAKPQTRAGNIMRNFSGRAWISESDYELVRLDVEAIDTVSIGFGLLARLHKGSQLSFQRRKINNEVWLPASAKYSLSARVGLFAVLRRGGSVEFSNYKKFSVDTSTVIGAPRKP